MKSTQLWNNEGRAVTHHAPELGESHKHTLEYEDGTTQPWNTEAEVEAFKAANNFSFTEKPKQNTVAVPANVMAWLKQNGLVVAPQAPAEAPAAEKAAA